MLISMIFIFIILLLTNKIAVTLLEILSQISICLIILLFPSNILLFNLITDFISFIRLKCQQIQIINPQFDRFGMIQSLSSQLSIFQQLQLEGFVKKQDSYSLNTINKYQNGFQLFKDFNDFREQSTISFMIWAGVFNLDKYQKHPQLKKYFNMYDFYYQQNQFNQSQYDSNDNNEINNNHQNQRIIQQQNQTIKYPIIRNINQNSIKIKWNFFKKYQISQKLIQSVIIKDSYNRNQPKPYIILSQGYLTKRQDYQYFQDILQQQNNLAYQTTLLNYLGRGKVIKYLAIKRKVTQMQINRMRHDIQYQLQYGGFLVFDYWPNYQNIQLLKELTKKQNGFNTKFISCKRSQAIQGYDHLIPNSSFIHSLKKERINEILKNKIQYSNILHIGKNIIDQNSLILADISVKMINQSPASADFFIRQNNQIISLIKQGRWNLDTKTLTLICLILFNFNRILCEILQYLSNKSNNKQLSIQLIPEQLYQFLIVYIGSILIPILLLNIYQRTDKLQSKKFKTFFRIDLIMNIFIIFIGMITLYSIEFMNHQFDGICFNTIQDNHKHTLHEFSNNKHLIYLRTNTHYQSSNNLNDNFTNSSCHHLLIYLTVLFNFFTLLLLDRSIQSRVTNNLYISHINKIYCFILSIFTIYYYSIPLMNAVRPTIIVFLLFGIFNFCQWIKNFNNIRLHNQTQENQ